MSYTTSITWRDMKTIPDKGSFLVYCPFVKNQYLVEIDEGKFRIFGTSWYLYDKPLFWAHLPETPSHEDLTTPAHSG